MYSTHHCIKHFIIADYVARISEISAAQNFENSYSSSCSYFVQYYINVLFIILENNDILAWFVYFLRIGCPQFTYPSYEPSTTSGASRSLFFPQEAINPHPRYRLVTTWQLCVITGMFTDLKHILFIFIALCLSSTLTRNIRDRRGSKVVINVPSKVDKAFMYLLYSVLLYFTFSSFLFTFLCQFSHFFFLTSFPLFLHLFFHHSTHLPILPWFIRSLFVCNFLPSFLPSFFPCSFLLPLLLPSSLTSSFPPSLSRPFSPPQSLSFLPAWRPLSGFLFLFPMSSLLLTFCSLSWHAET